MAKPNRPKLLFLAFHFPPSRSVASVRAANVAKYLSRSGWDVCVVTPDPMLWQSPDDPQRIAVELDHWGVQRIYTSHRWRFLSSGHLKRSYSRGMGWFFEGIPRRIARAMGIDEMIGWYPEVMRACMKLRPGEVDVVMATGGPFGAFRVAQNLSQRLGCPYILDYRDLWTGNPHSRSATQKHNENIERRLLQDCAAVMVVSPSTAKFLGARFSLEEKINVIPNGYAPDDFDGIEPTAFGHFAIVYAGQFLPPKRTAGPLMQVLRRLAEIDPALPWRFHYYGPNNDHVLNIARTQGVEKHVELHGVVSRRECLAAIGGAGVAIIVISDFDTGDITDRGIITGKIFEPIGLGTPILVIAPLQSDVETVVHTVGKGATFTGSNVEGMAMFLANLLRGKQIGSKQPEEYAWPNLIQKMDILLRSTMMKYQCAGRYEVSKETDSP